MAPSDRCGDEDPRLAPTSDYDGFALHEWMWSPSGLNLGIGSLDLMVYAKVYSVSHHNTGAMTASQPKLAQLFGVTREAVNRSLRRLVDGGLVFVCGNVRGHGQGGRPVNVYAACQAPIETALSRCRSSAELNQLSGAQWLPALANVTAGSRTAANVTDGSRPDVTPGSHSNVTPESNVTGGSRSQTTAPTCESFDSGHMPLTTNTDSNSKGKEDKGRDLTETEFLAFQKLMSMSLKPTPDRYSEETRRCFVACVDEGIGPELLLTAYGRYARKLLASKRSGGEYHPMSLSHFLMRRRRKDGAVAHNEWIEEAVNEAQAEQGTSRRETKFLRDNASRYWIAFPPGGNPEYVPGIGADADEAQARDAWEAYAATKTGPRR